MKKEKLKGLDSNIEYRYLKKIRDITISSLVIQIIALAIGVIGCLGIAALFIGKTSSIKTLEDLFNILISNKIYLGLVGGFLLLSFISFFLLPIIATCKYGTNLKNENKDINKLLILVTPASLVFLAFIVILWPIFTLVIIGKADYRMKKIVKALTETKDEPKSKIIDLTGTGVKKPTEEEIVDPTKTVSPQGPQPVSPQGSTIYRPGQAPQQNHNPNRIYLRTPGSSPAPRSYGAPVLGAARPQPSGSVYPPRPSNN